MRIREHVHPPPFIFISILALACARPAHASRRHTESVRTLLARILIDSTDSRRRSALPFGDPSSKSRDVLFFVPLSVCSPSVKDGSREENVPHGHFLLTFYRVHHLPTYCRRCLCTFFCNIKVMHAVAAKRQLNQKFGFFKKVESCSSSARSRRRTLGFLWTLGTYRIFLHRIMVEDKHSCVRAPQASKWFKCIRPERPAHGTLSACFGTLNKKPFRRKKSYSLSATHHHPFFHSDWFYCSTSFCEPFHSIPSC